MVHHFKFRAKLIPIVIGQTSTPRSLADIYTSKWELMTRFISNEVEGERDGRAVAVAVARMMMPVDLLFLPSFRPLFARSPAMKAQKIILAAGSQQPDRQPAETATPNIQPASQFACPLKQGLVGYMDM